MLEGIDINQRIEFSLKADVTEPKTVFILKPLSGSDMFNFSSHVSDGKMSLSGDRIIDLLEKSVVEIKHYKDNLTVAEALKTLKIDSLAELLEKVNSLNNISEEEAKN